MPFSTADKIVRPIHTAVNKSISTVNCIKEKLDNISSDINSLVSNALHLLEIPKSQIEDWIDEKKRR